MRDRLGCGRLVSGYRRLFSVYKGPNSIGHHGFSVIGHIIVICNLTLPHNEYTHTQWLILIIQFTTSYLQCDKQQSCYGLKNTITVDTSSWT